MIRDSIIKEIDQASTASKKESNPITVPSYLRKIRFGSELSKHLEKAKRHQSKSKSDIKDALLMQFSTSGILGKSPSLFEQNEEYIDQLIKIFEQKAIAKSTIDGKNSDQSDCDDSEKLSSHNENKVNSDPDDLGTSDDDNDSAPKMTIGRYKKDKKIIDLSNLQFYSSSTLATILPIPSKWVHPQELSSNVDNNCPFEVTIDGCDISTKDLMRRKPTRTSGGRFSSGSSSSRNSFFSTRSDHHVSRLTTVYYFEVEILFSLNSGADVSIGFFDLSENDNPVSDLRGHDAGSWGYCEIPFLSLRMGFMSVKPSPYRTRLRDCSQPSVYHNGM
ncbi:unnamed protein product [Ambrosiozyma monospora]|uniref:Unnamed protein product n=1 Tax=Ambrosiozyma monospora TaxID=43982 RepID=A0A9W6Z063_AMBMO|nr:unnamed protein product [Ambrosiozyma monospora]